MIDTDTCRVQLTHSHFCCLLFLGIVSFTLSIRVGGFSRNKQDAVKFGL